MRAGVDGCRRGAAEGEIHHRRGEQRGAKLRRIAAGADGVFCLDHIVVGRPCGRCGIHIAGRGRGEITGNCGITTGCPSRSRGLCLVSKRLRK